MLIIVISIIAVQTSPVQNWLVGIATKNISEKLGTEVKIKNVIFSLFNRMNIEGLLLRDKAKDTIVYAGAIKLRITDWFFIKDKSEIKYLGLEDALIQLQRKDSIWNYQFIADHLSSPPSKDKKSKPIQIDIKKIDFKNVHFISKDLWRGETIQVKVGSLVVNADSINLNKKTFRINSIDIDNPLFALSDYKGLIPDSLLTKINPITTLDTGLRMNTNNLNVKVGKMAITNGTLSIESNQNKPLPYFDGSHIYITKLNGKFNNTNLVKDTLQSDVLLNAKERCGLILKKLQAHYKVTPSIMEFAKLELETNKSKLNNYYAMKFQHFNHDFGDYINEVIMDANLKDAKVSSDDIAFFAPELKLWKTVAVISGNFLGTVANFNVKNLFAKNNSSTYITGNFSMKGLPNIHSTIINFKNGIIKTNYNDAGIYAPIIKQVKLPNLAALGNVLFRGNYTGTIYDFKTNGNVSSDLGSVAADVAMKLSATKDDTYSGSVTTTQFNIGKFLETDKLGTVDFKGKISGTNFSIAKLKTSIEGNISKLAFNDYTYSNITTNGIFQKKYFSGEVNIDDPNLELKSQVEIDLTKEIPIYNILGDLVKSNFKPLNFYKENVYLTGLLDIDFSASNIDNFSGSAKLLNANIGNDFNTLSFDSLNLSSGLNQNKKFLHLGSNDFSAFIIGDFRILDLQTNFQSFLHRYFPSYINAPKDNPTKQDFVFNINSNYIEPYLKLFNTKLSGFNNANIFGGIDTKKDIFNLNLSLPYGQFEKYSLTDANIFGLGNFDSLQFVGSIASVQVSDSLNFPNTHINITSSNDHSTISLKTSASNTLNEADLNAEVYTLQKGIRIHFNPSSFILNEKRWYLEKQGEISITQDYVSAQNVKFYQGFQEIVVETENEDGDYKNNLIVKLKNIVLGDITSLFFKDPKMEGLLTGEIHLHDFYGKFNIEANLNAEQFRLNNDSIGIINIKSNFIKASKLINFNVSSPNNQYNLTADGSYNFTDTAASPLDIAVHLKNSKINFIQQFLSGIFSNVSGLAAGELSIKGKPQSPNLLGKIYLHKAGLKVDYTQVYYSIDSANIAFDEDGINFGEINVYDTLHNKAVLKGKLLEKGFKNINFDFDLTTNNLLLIDTKQTDNQQFYGRVIGKATLSFKGPLNNCKMLITAESTDSSHIYIPSSVSRDNGQADFIVFKQYGSEIQKETADNEANFNVSVDLDITANNKTTIDVILDPLSGDVIKAVGNGHLKIKAGSTEPLNIIGRYDIEQGSYDFSFQSFIRKPFILKPDANNYIEWTGDPLNANIHIDALYTADNVSLSDLVGTRFNGSSGSSGSSNNAVNLYRGPVYVIASLTDKLSKPTINFKLDFPQGSPLKSNPDFVDFISNIERDNNEILKQVSYLLVFGMFAPSSNNGVAGNFNFSSFGASTISQLISKEINKTLSNVLNKVFHDKRLHVDIGTSVYNSTNLLQNINGGSGYVTTNGFDRSRFNLKLGYSLFNDKVVITVGGDLDMNIGATANLPTQWLPDFNAEWFFTSDRKLRIIFFSKNSLDYGASTSGNAFGKLSRQGVGLSYKKDFEKLFATKQEDIEFKSAASANTKKEGTN